MSKILVCLLFLLGCSIDLSQIEGKCFIPNNYYNQTVKVIKCKDNGRYFTSDQSYCIIHILSKRYIKEDTEELIVLFKSIEVSCPKEDPNAE